MSFSRCLLLILFGMSWSSLVHAEEVLEAAITKSQAAVEDTFSFDVVVNETADFIELAPMPTADAANSATQPKSNESFSTKVIQNSLLLQAKDYDIRKVPSREKEKLELYKNSLLNWTNPRRKTEQGVMVAWQDEGMPVVLATLFTYEWYGVKLKHELISLADSELSAQYGGRDVWTPSKAALSWTEWADTIKKVGDVSSSKPRRLAQMRAIARQFTLTMTNEEGKTEQLRLLSQPLHRFASKKYATTDGAVFAFASGTDPEALLVIRGSSENQKWEYAFLRSMYYELTAKLRDKQVWRVKSVMAEHVNASVGDPAVVRSQYSSFHLTPDRLFRPHPDLKAEK